MSVRVIHRSIEDILADSPEILYKYRTWLNPNYPFHKTILTERKIYMSPPSEFEDLMDCKGAKRYDLMTPLDIWKRHYNYLHQHFPSINEFHIQEMATRDFLKSNFFDKNYVEWVTKDYSQKLDKHFGVLSLTANPRIPKMWTKYADNHSGICVGLKSSILFDLKYIGGGGIVNYVDELPIINHDDDHDEEFMKQVQHKEEKWRFEEEYRTYKLWPHPASPKHRGRVLPPEAFKEVIFGAHLKADQKKKIHNICKRQGMK
jgi:hypothetical protein